MTYYFDVLPIHPRPEYLESLTSYLMRLAQCNGISSIDGISALCFPLQDRRNTRDIADRPPMSFDGLIVAGVCTKEVLQTTTFFHLAANFGRSTLPQPVSRFLSGSISQYLRYCSLCLAGQKACYYLLPWRFLGLTCCCQHKCRLLEVCGHCGKLIPLFTAPFKLGYCPICQRSLKQCPATLVTDEIELEAATQMQDDIVFLLKPQPWGADSGNIVRRVGRKLAHARQMRQLTIREVAGQIGVTLTMVEGVERGNFQNKGATLQCYFKYTHYLDLSLKKVFSDAIGTPDPAAPVSPLCPACQQNCYVTRNGCNPSGSQRYGCRNCHRCFTVSPIDRWAKRRSS